MDKDKSKDTQPQEEELITSSGSGIAQVDESRRGLRGARGNRGKIQPKEEELITSSGSGIAQVDESRRGLRGARGNRGKIQPKEEELITSSGSGIAEISRPRGREALNQKRSSAKVEKTDRHLPETFILNGKKYKTVSLISASTAEARVILVEREGKRYALKLYYANIGHGPDPEVLQMVKDADDDHLIKIYDFGVWVNPQDSDEECDYELMQYCEGGPLKPGSLHGDPQRLVDVTFDMLTAAATCAAIGFIHRDIKPENFLWVDKEQTRLVLSDFGFAVPCVKGESVKVADHRTKIYTAPEFYFRAPNLPAKIDCMSDTYSVGISMLTLWSGEEVMMGMTETDLMANKNREKLPYPEDMDQDLLLLMKGLTRARPDERWDSDKIIRWNRDELEEQDKSFDVAADFDIPFDTAKGLVAHSLGELADMMIHHQTQAKKYLYGGRVTKWFKNAGTKELNRMADDVEWIVENVYPKDQDAGLWSVIYLISPSTPYYFPGADFSIKSDPDNQASCLKDIGVLIWNKLIVKNNHLFMEKFMKEFESPGSRLAIYLEKESAKDLFNKIHDMYNGETSMQSKLIRMLQGKSDRQLLTLFMYNLNPDLPWLMKDGVVDTVPELLDRLKAERVPQFNLHDEAFIQWLLPRNPVMAARVKNLHDRTQGEPSEWDVAYALSPYMDFTLSSNPDDEDRVFTPEELAEELNTYIFADFDTFMDGEEAFAVICMEDKGDNALAYLRSKGKYDELLSWIESCRTEEESNEKKYGPYNAQYAAFKILKGVAGGKAPFYEFPDGRQVRSMEELESIEKPVLKEALENGALAAWIATFYQENPYFKLQQKYAYEKETERFIRRIGMLDPTYPDFVKFENAERRINMALSQAADVEKKTRIMKFVVIPLMLIPFIIVGVMTAVKGIPDYNPVTGHFWVTAIALSVVGFLLVKFGDQSIGTALVGGAVIGFGGTWLLSLLLGFVSPWLTWIYVGIVVLVAIGMCRFMMYYTHPPVDDRNAPDYKNPDYQFRELEALHYAFKNENATLDRTAPNGNFTFDHYATNYAKAGKKRFRVGLSQIPVYLVITVALFFGLYFLSPAVGGQHSIAYATLNPGPQVMGKYSGTVGEKGKGSLAIDSLTGTRVDSALITVNGNSLLLQGSVKRTGAKEYELSLMPALGSDSLSQLAGAYNLVINLKKNTCNGEFIPSSPDKNGETIPQEISFSLGNEEAEAEAAKPQKTGKSNKSGKNSGKSSSATKSKTPEETASTSSANVEETESPVRPSGFKLEEVDQLPGSGSKTEAPVKPSGFKLEEVDHLPGSGGSTSGGPTGRD